MDLIKIAVLACFFISSTSSETLKLETSSESLQDQSQPKRSTGKTCKNEGCCGTHGVPGAPGVPGVPGQNGRVGQRGVQGATGARGPKGDPGDVITHKRNWKQCSWNRGDGKDNGVIKECTFVKQHDKTHLRVFYGGSLRIYNCDNCCKRWFFTFNGAECNLPIDGIFYIWKGRNTEETLRHRHIEGYCGNIPKGNVRVSFNVGNCAGYGNADAYSGWNSVSRIVIEEVPPPQQ